MAPRRKNKGIGGAAFCHGLSGAVLVTAAAAMLAAPATAGVILTLSTNSSEPGIDPSLLSATFEFQITGVLQNELTLTVTNNTSAPNEFNMNRIFFNAGGNVTGLNLTGGGGGGAWELMVPAFPGDLTTHADNFGIFDFMLQHGPPLGHNHHLIEPGLANQRVFTFDIKGTGPFFDTDFTTELSESFNSNMLMFAAAKFVQGPGDASAFGGVPEPGTLALLGLAGLLGLRGRRRPI